MIDWQRLLDTPYGTLLEHLCTDPEPVPDGYPWRYRTAPDQYLHVDRTSDGPLRYRGFAWFGSEGAARLIRFRQGWIDVGRTARPPSALLPKPGMLQADDIAKYGRRTEPEGFTRYVEFTHRVSFGDFVYHFEMVTPRPGDAPIAIEVDRYHCPPHLMIELGPRRWDRRGPA